LRVGEALALTWEDVVFDPVGTAKRGYVSVREGKSKFAKRNVSLTEAARVALLKQKQLSKSNYVFVRKDGITPVSRYTLSGQHAGLRKKLKLPADAVLHSLRHTMLTQLGASGADVFTIMRIAGHSSVTVSQKYIHPTPESLEGAMDKLEIFQLASKDENKQVAVPAHTIESVTIQ
jgi:integrase